MTGDTLREPWLQDPDATFYHGDCLEVLRELPAGSVHMCATSPPFYGLRSYIADGHEDKPLEIGLEETPDQWVNSLVAVFREVRRVLRDDGTLWVEIGDSYSAQGGGKAEGQYEEKRVPGATWQAARSPSPGTKPKDLLGQPWLLAFALRDDGWYLRSEIIWARPNPMPESVRDRPTKSHSTVFLLSKSPRYFYDADAIRDAWADHRNGASGATRSKYEHPGAMRQDGGVTSPPQTSGANARSVWTISTEPTPFAHFATWPQALVRRMILAGTSERGCCPECGAPWVRDVERTPMEVDPSPKRAAWQDSGDDFARTQIGGTVTKPASSRTLGWSPSCDCTNGEPGLFTTPCTVLDPFAGSGTTSLVARNHGRRSIGIELNESYIEIAARRLQQLSLLADA